MFTSLRLHPEALTGIAAVMAIQCGMAEVDCEPHGLQLMAWPFDQDTVQDTCTHKKVNIKYNKFPS